MFERLRNKLGISAIPQIFISAAVIAILFVAFAIPFKEQFAAFFESIGDFTFLYFGWFYVASVSGLLIFLPLWFLSAGSG